jgi:hypothetical protein
MRGQGRTQKSQEILDFLGEAAVDLEVAMASSPVSFPRLALGSKSLDEEMTLAKHWLRSPECPPHEMQEIRWAVKKVSEVFLKAEEMREDRTQQPRISQQTTRLPHLKLPRVSGKEYLLEREMGEFENALFGRPDMEKLAYAKQSFPETLVLKIQFAATWQEARKMILSGASSLSLQIPRLLANITFRRKLTSADQQQELQNTTDLLETLSCLTAITKGEDRSFSLAEHQVITMINSYCAATYSQLHDKVMVQATMVRRGESTWLEAATEILSSYNRKLSAALACNHMMEEAARSMNAAAGLPDQQMVDTAPPVYTNKVELETTGMEQEVVSQTCAWCPAKGRGDPERHFSFQCQKLKLVRDGRLSVPATLCEICLVTRSFGKHGLDSCGTKQSRMDPSNSYVLFCTHKKNNKICKSCFDEKEKQKRDRSDAKRRLADQKAQLEAAAAAATPAAPEREKAPAQPAATEQGEVVTDLAEVSSFAVQYLNNIKIGQTESLAEKIQLQPPGGGDPVNIVLSYDGHNGAALAQVSLSGLGVSLGQTDGLKVSTVNGDEISSFGAQRCTILTKNGSLEVEALLKPGLKAARPRRVAWPREWTAQGYSPQENWTEDGIVGTILLGNDTDGIFPVPVVDANGKQVRTKRCSLWRSLLTGSYLLRGAATPTNISSQDTDICIEVPELVGLDCLRVEMVPNISVINDLLASDDQHSGCDTVNTEPNYERSEGLNCCCSLVEAVQLPGIPSLATTAIPELPDHEEILNLHIKEVCTKLEADGVKTITNCSDCCPRLKLLKETKQMEDQRIARGISFLLDPNGRKGHFFYKRPFKGAVASLPSYREQALNFSKRASRLLERQPNSRAEVTYRLQKDFVAGRLMWTEDYMKKHGLTQDECETSYTGILLCRKLDSISTPIRVTQVPVISTPGAPCFNETLNSGHARLPQVEKVHLRLRLAEGVSVNDIKDQYKSTEIDPVSALRSQILVQCEGGLPYLGLPQDPDVQWRAACYTHSSYGVSDAGSMANITKERSTEEYKKHYTGPDKTHDEILDRNTQDLTWSFADDVHIAIWAHEVSKRLEEAKEAIPNGEIVPSRRVILHNMMTERCQALESTLGFCGMDLKGWHSTVGGVKASLQNSQPPAAPDPRLPPRPAAWRVHQESRRHQAHVLPPATPQGAPDPPLVPAANNAQQEEVFDCLGMNYYPQKDEMMLKKQHFNLSTKKQGSKDPRYDIRCIDDFDRYILQQGNLTRAQTLSFIMATFDPCMTSHGAVNLVGKIYFREMLLKESSKVAWTDRMSKQDLPKWRELVQFWLQSAGRRIRRMCVLPNCPRLHVITLSDASEVARAHLVYLVSCDEEDIPKQVSLVKVATSLAPIHNSCATVPRLELASLDSALITTKSIIGSLEDNGYTVASFRLTCDSTATIQQTRSLPARFQRHFATHIGRIQGNLHDLGANPFSHIYYWAQSSEKYLVDQVTKHKVGANLTAIMNSLHDAECLHKPMSSWNFMTLQLPTKNKMAELPGVNPKLLSEEEEREVSEAHKNKMTPTHIPCMSTALMEGQEAFDPLLTKWQSRGLGPRGPVRLLAKCLLMTRDRWRRKHRDHQTPQTNVYTADQLQEADRHITLMLARHAAAPTASALENNNGGYNIKKHEHWSGDLFTAESRELRCLSGQTVGRVVMICVGATTAFGKLLIHWAHQHHHRSSVKAHQFYLMRNSFFVPGSHGPIKALLNGGCTECIRQRVLHDAVNEVSDAGPVDVLHQRLSAAPAAWCQADILGPILCKSTLPSLDKKRRYDEERPHLHKVYVLIFICTVTKYVSAHLMKDFSAAEALQCLMQYKAKVGQPLRVYSDHGSSYSPFANHRTLPDSTVEEDDEDEAQEDLRAIYEDVTIAKWLESAQFQQQLASLGTVWTVVAPKAHKRVGSAEKVVAAFKRIWAGRTRGPPPDVISLQRQLDRMSDICNWRPILAQGGQLLCPNSFRAAAALHSGLDGPLNKTENKLHNVNVEAIRSETEYLLKVWDEVYFQNAIKWSKNKFSSDNIRPNDVCILKDRVALKKPSGLNGSLGRVVALSDGGRNVWLRGADGSTLRRSPEDVALLLHYDTEASGVAVDLDVLAGAADLPAIFSKQEEVAMPDLVPPPIHHSNGGSKVPTTTAPAPPPPTATPRAPATPPPHPATPIASAASPQTPLLGRGQRIRAKAYAPGTLKW